jgi:hypothetical protein
LIAKPKSKKRKQLKRKPVSVKRKAINRAKNIPKIIPAFHSVPKPGIRNGIRQVSHRQSEREHNLQRLNHYLRAVRAGGLCEICGSSYHLQGAHIIERSTGGHDNAGNIIIACGTCHDHAQYTHGLPINPVEALALVAQKNREHGISKFLTGDQVPNEGEYESI